VAIFSVVTDEFVLVPHSILPKEIKVVEKELEVRVIKANIGSTSLLGVLAKGLGNKIIVSNIIEDSEIKALEKEGIEVLKLNGFSSTGNLIAMNQNGGIASPLISEKSQKEIENFLGIKFKKMLIAGTDLPGAAITVTNKGFIAHPNITEKDFSLLKSTFKVNGSATTANYGDLFVGNSVIGNSKGVLAGNLTSGIELSKIDEGMRGE